MRHFINLIILSFIRYLICCVKFQGKFWVGTWSSWKHNWFQASKQTTWMGFKEGKNFLLFSVSRFTFLFPHWFLLLGSHSSSSLLFFFFLILLIPVSLDLVNMYWLFDRLLADPNILCAQNCHFCKSHMVSNYFIQTVSCCSIFFFSDKVCCYVLLFIAGTVSKEAGPVSMTFSIPMYNASRLQVNNIASSILVVYSSTFLRNIWKSRFSMVIGSINLFMQVKYLQIVKKSKTDNPYRWVRYVTQANSYVARL